MCSIIQHGMRCVPRCRLTAIALHSQPCLLRCCRNPLIPGPGGHAQNRFDFEAGNAVGGIELGSAVAVDFDQNALTVGHCYCVPDELPCFVAAHYTRVAALLGRDWLPDHRMAISSISRVSCAS